VGSESRGAKRQEELVTKLVVPHGDEILSRLFVVEYGNFLVLGLPDA
jgi:hypothetical protein